MGRMSRWTSTAAALSALLSLAPAAVGAQPMVAATHGQVTIYRDGKGVPHVFGETSAAVMYGLGYTLAQDRLAELELSRRGAEGRKAEILGKGALKADLEARDRLLPAAELVRMYQALPAEHQAMMQAMVDGLNRGIAEVQQDPQHKTPYEFAKWGVPVTPWTLLEFLDYVSKPHNKSYELQNLAFLNAMVGRYGSKVGRQIFDDVVPISDPDSPTTIPAGDDLAPAQPMPKGAPYPVGPLGKALSAYARPDAPGEPASGASRCLVIGPEKSASGYPLMLQSTSDGPEVDLHGGGFDTAGFSHAGWGPPFMGRAWDHGWLMTSGHADTHDMYAEKLNPADKYQYWFKGAWRTMDHHTETVPVKGGAPVTHEVAWTVHGPVLAWDTAHGVAYSEKSAERGHELESWTAVVEMGRARSLPEFQKAVSGMIWSVGVCYADTAGKIGFWEAGAIPTRPATVDSRLPTPGTGEYEWTGVLDFDHKPHMLNPKQGFIHTWNSKATSWSQEGDDARVGATFRTWEGTRLAAGAQGVTLLDMREFNRKIWNAYGGRDRTQASPDFFAPYLKAAAAKSTDPEVKDAAALMLSFNGLYEDVDGDGRYDSAGAPLWHRWLEVAPEMVFGPGIGDWYAKIDADRYHKYQTSLLYRAFQGKAAGAPLQFDYFKGRDPDTVIAQAIRKTIDDLRPQFGAAPLKDWRQPVYWKYFDPSKRTADKPGLPHDEVSARTWAQLGLGPAVVKHEGGEGWIGLMELDPKAPALYSAVEAGGQDLFIDPAGHGNPHLTDQIALHTGSNFKKIDMAPDEIRRTAVSTTKLDF